MNKPILPFVETMITQVCNLSCTGCTNYSDLPHKGYVPWSEEYDNFSGADRIKHIHGLLDQISQWSIIELENKLVGMKEILDHNRTIFKKLTNAKIVKIFNA